MLLLPLMVVVDKLWEQRRRGLLALVAILVLLVISAAVVWAIRWRPVLNGLWRVLTFPFVTSVVLPGISVIDAWDVRWRPVFSAPRARRLLGGGHRQSARRRPTNFARPVTRHRFPRTRPGPAASGTSHAQATRMHPHSLGELSTTTRSDQASPAGVTAS